MRIRSLLLAAAVLAGAGTTTLPAAGTTYDDHAPVQAALDQSRSGGVSPGAGLTVRTAGSVWSLSSGTGWVGADKPITPATRVRVASNTKMFVAAVVLQLVAAGKVDLDAPIERYLPGVVQGNYYDGSKITVRQLLQHTSGIADYVTPVLFMNPANHYRTFTDAEHVKSAMGIRPTGAPGAKWSYSNTNYILAGMLIEKVTGHPAAAEVKTRIIDELGLTDTYLPATGDKWINGTHARGYVGYFSFYLDSTGTEPSMIGAAGAMVSTGADLTKFLRALLTDRTVLPAAQLAEMRKSVDMGGGARYGLGLFSQKLSCTELWGHSGGWTGYATYAVGSTDGRQVFTVHNAYGLPGMASVDIKKVLETALCG